MKNILAKFNLLQYFFVTGFIALFFTIALSIFYESQSRQELLISWEENNIALARSISNSLDREFSAFLADIESFDADKLSNQPQIALLEKAVGRQIQGLSVAKVKIYDLTGTTIFSTDKAQIGQNKSNSEAFLSAKSGQVITQLDRRNSFQALSGNLTNIYLISSYIPVYSQDGTKKLENVFEIYSDVTPLLKQIETNKKNVILGTFSCFFILYFILFIIFKRAKKVIDAQHIALRESQEKYKQQAQSQARVAKLAKATTVIIDKIRHSHNVDTIFKDITKQVRHLLKSDRAVIYKFNPDWSGQVVAESVGSGWISLLEEQNNDEVLQSDRLQHDRCLVRDWFQGEQNVFEADTFLQETRGGKYVHGQKFSAVDDIYTKGFRDCYLESLKKYQVRAYLIVPIFQAEKLWGLLGAYQNDGTRTWQESEIDLMILIANQLTAALQRVEYINLLKLQKRDLEITIKELKLAQNHLIQQEKLAALGQLVAGIAHEINTPLGAIQASAGDNTKALSTAITEIPRLSEYLSQAEKDTFFELLECAMMTKPFYSSSEKRPLKRQITKQLKEYNIDNARSVADLLIDIGIYDEIDLYLSLFKHPKVDWILNLIYNLSSLKGNNRTIITSVEKASKVVFALKSYARFDHSESLHLADITKGIETVLEIYHNQLKHKVNVVRRYQEIPTIWCYPDELIQVWTNLIYNGIQAMKNGGELTITTSQENKGIKVEISDSGSGIPEAVQDKIFEPFFTTKPTGEGSGLGLHISKKIIDKHQGTIAVDSKPGHTRFSIWLPLINEQKAIHN